jgi:hypothetical protein
MEKTTAKQTKDQASSDKELLAVLQALKKSGTRAGTGDQMDEIRKAKR